MNINNIIKLHFLWEKLIPEWLSPWYYRWTLAFHRLHWSLFSQYLTQRSNPLIQFVNWGMSIIKSADRIAVSGFDCRCGRVCFWTWWYMGCRWIAKGLFSIHDWHGGGYYLFFTRSNFNKTRRKINSSLPPNYIYLHIYNAILHIL